MHVFRNHVISLMTKRLKTDNNKQMILFDRHKRIVSNTIEEVVKEEEKYYNADNETKEEIYVNTAEMDFKSFGNLSSLKFRDSISTAYEQRIQMTRDDEFENKLIGFFDEDMCACNEMFLSTVYVLRNI